MAQWVVLYEAYNAIFKLTELELLPHGVSLPQIHLLGALKGRGGKLTIGEIGRAMVKESQTVTGLVSRLEKRGLVQKAFDSLDLRKTGVRLTEKGESELAEAQPLVNRLVEELFAVMSDRDLQDLRAAVEKLRTAGMDRLDSASG